MYAYAAHDYIVRILVFAGVIYSIYLAGRIAERRGRSSKTWLWIAAGLLGPLALPLLFLLPNLRRNDSGDPGGEQRLGDSIGAAKPVMTGNPDSNHLNNGLYAVAMTGSG